MNKKFPYGKYVLWTVIGIIVLILVWAGLS